MFKLRCLLPLIGAAGRGSFFRILRDSAHAMFSVSVALLLYAYPELPVPFSVIVQVLSLVYSVIFLKTTVVIFGIIIIIIEIQILLVIVFFFFFLFFLNSNLFQRKLLGLKLYWQASSHS